MSSEGSGTRQRIRILAVLVRDGFATATPESGVQLIALESHQKVLRIPGKGLNVESSARAPRQEIIPDATYPWAQTAPMAPGAAGLPL
jgi:hypothetical protein